MLAPYKVKGQPLKYIFAEFRTLAHSDDCKLFTLANAFNFPIFEIKKGYLLRYKTREYFI